jgi:Flp pilus assembly protein TadG
MKMLNHPRFDRSAFRMPRRLADQRGQSAVELALSIPLLIVLLLAAVEFGQIFYTQTCVTNAARAGAQNITTAGGTAAGIEQAALADAPNISGLPATASHFCQCANGGASTCLATDARAAIACSMSSSIRAPSIRR